MSNWAAAGLRLGSEFIATTSLKAQRAGGAVVEDAMEKAAGLGLRFVDRDGLKGELEGLGRVDVLIFMDGAIRLARFEGGAMKSSLQFHPSTSFLRIARMKSGQSDVMVNALGIAPGDRVLDCTMGLGSDSITAAWAAGELGRVTALESSGPLFVAMDLGMSAYSGSEDVVAALGRVDRINLPYREYLEGCPDSSYDAVYMDPMFGSHIYGSPVDAIRAWAEEGMPSQDDLQEALRVTRNRLVVKLRKGEGIDGLSRMPGFTVFHSSKAGSVQYVGIRKGA